ncbi:hypothetical protein CC86DRAFT_285937 [Ophiobolus disseminans]|uniref:BHLH domain-containing protein n=1 Tax=Ophiobolus disseminans TaxID=1469910 RepID=A0A6A7ABQ9_9PLEO|nr:hypothetical protein CC86DRAFT_285937 [Ophiobolus disseminans]
MVNSDYSPSQAILAYPDSFETDDYTTSPNCSLSTYFDSDSFFDRPLTSIEMIPTGFPSKPSPFKPTLSATGISATESQPEFQQAYYQAPFGQLDPFASGFSLDPASINAFESTPFSPTTPTSSRTPSLCGDAQQQARSPPLSPPLVKREASFSPALGEETASARPLRKRGRPRLDRVAADSQSTGSSSGKQSRGGRLPHNQVERKYREGLNSELERLRKTVPTLPQIEDGGAMGQPKPSKAMVLSSAIDYIRKIENERDALKEEVEKLRQNQGQSMGWTRADNSLDEFLMDP